MKLNDNRTSKTMARIDSILDEPISPMSNLSGSEDNDDDSPYPP